MRNNWASAAVRSCVLMAEELKPARYEEPKRRAFAPKLPWKLGLFVMIAVAVVFGGHRWQERSRALQLKSSILSRYQANALPVRERLTGFRDKIEAWVQAVVAETPETWADERLNLAGLHRASGIYLRVHADHADSSEAIAQAARNMEPDAITQCLGLAPVSLRGFYHRLKFFEPAWEDNVRQSDQPLRLRVLHAELDNRLSEDVPLLMDMVHSAYFLLTVQHGENRADNPVDVYLWDLRNDALLLKTRVQAEGRLLSVRIGVGGEVRGAAPALDAPATATDCSIAAQIRAVADRQGPGGDRAAPTDQATPAVELAPEN